jgi:hypothetical protein
MSKRKAHNITVPGNSKGRDVENVWNTFLNPTQMRYNLDSRLVKTISAEIDLCTLLFSWCLCPVVYGRAVY